MKSFCLLVVFSALTPVSTAAAQGTDTNIDSNLLWLAAGPSDFMTLRSATVAPHMHGLGGAFAQVHHRSVVAFRSTGEEATLVGPAVQVDLLAAWGLWDRVQIGLAQPVTLVQAGTGVGPLMGEEDRGWRVDTFLFRDLRIAVDWAPLGLREHQQEGLKLLVSVAAALPWGARGYFATNDSIVVAPQLVVDYRFGEFLVALDTTARIATMEHSLGQSRFGSSIVTRLGFRWLLDEDRAGISLEGSGIFQLAEQPPTATVEQFAFEGGLGAFWAPRSTDFSLRGAFTAGVGGFGAPVFRLVIGTDYGRLF